MDWTGSLRRWLEFWNRPSTSYVAVVVCAVYATMMLTRLVLAPDSASDTLRRVLDTTDWGLLLFMGVNIGAVALLTVRRRYPVASLLAISLLMLITAAVYGSAYTYLLLAWLVSLYACTVEARQLHHLIACLTATGLMALGSVTLATLWHADTDFVNLLYPTTLLVAVCIGLGLVSRTQREQRVSEQALREERERSSHLARQRDQAVSQSRIAAQLHDSVGHDLTAVIALSEGLDHATGRSEIDDAITMINDLARQGLEDTRTAVKALQPTVGDDVHALPTDEPEHHWDDITPILEHARQIGMTVALSETGRRPNDPKQADLCFTVTREAVTNAIRHARGASRIVISWDHDDNGAITITVTDNGTRPNPNPNHHPNSGTGLNRLRQTIEQYGGTLQASPSSNGWVLRAFIPPLEESQSADNHQAARSEL